MAVSLTSKGKLLTAMLSSDMTELAMVYSIQFASSQWFMPHLIIVDLIIAPQSLIAPPIIALQSLIAPPIIALRVWFIGSINVSPGRPSN